jgi:hypothetical protein
MTPSEQLPPAYPAPIAPPPAGYQQVPSVKPVGTGLATAALVVGIVAFLLGWVTLLGGLLGAAGIILGILAVRTGRARARAIVGLVLSVIAFLTNVVISVGVIVTLLTPGAYQGLVGLVGSNAPDTSASPVDAADVQTVTLDTPCYSFDAPAAYMNNQSKDATAACATNAELWGEYNADGTVKNTGVGAILGSVNVEAISTVSSAGFAPDGTLEGMMGYLDAEFIPAMGTVIGQPENLTIDGTPATLTRITSTVAETKTKALIVLRAPDAYQTADKDAQFFLLSVVTPEDNGDAIIDAAISSWTWQ